jgi:hypothetical protein
MPAYYVEWHMRSELAEWLFDDHERESAEKTRVSVVSPAPRSDAAKLKEQRRRTPDGFPVQRFQCLLKDLATRCKNRVRWNSSPDVEFERMTLPTDLQRRIFNLLGLASVRRQNREVSSLTILQDSLCFTTKSAATLRKNTA